MTTSNKDLISRTLAKRMIMDVNSLSMKKLINFYKWNHFFANHFIVGKKVWLKILMD